MPRCRVTSVVMARSTTTLSRAPAPLAAPAQRPNADDGDGDPSPRLQGLDNNPQGASGPQFWKNFREILAHLYTLSLPDSSEEARFTFSTRTYPTSRAILMRTQGTAFTMSRGPALIARGSADQVIIYLQLEGSCDADCAGRRHRMQPGDIQIVDYARPFHSASTDYANLMVHLTRESLPASLLALEPHGVVFSRSSGAARLIGAALQEFYAQADRLTVSDAEAAVEGVVALTTACVRAKMASDEANHVKSRRKSALDYIDGHLGNAELGPDEIAEAAAVSRASLYRLLAAEGGIRAVLLKRRLDEALRLMLADGNDGRSLIEIAARCGFGGASQFSRAFRTRFGVPPREYITLLRKQDVDWHKARFMADGFDPDMFAWRRPDARGGEAQHPGSQNSDIGPPLSEDLPE